MKLVQFNILLTGNHNTDNEVQIMHTSAQSSSFGDKTSLPSTVRGCGQGMDTRQLPPSGFQPSANPVLAETFERHWQQLRGIAAHNVRHLLFHYHIFITFYILLLLDADELKLFCKLSLVYKKE